MNSTRIVRFSFGAEPQLKTDQSVAYMYLGLAVRTCLSAGFNRDVPSPGDNGQRSGWISKTWW